MLARNGQFQGPICCDLQITPSATGGNKVSNNPYAAPTTHVEDIVQSGPEGNFIAQGRTRPAANGWAWIKSARALTKQQIWLWIGVLVAYVVISVALSTIPVVGPFLLYPIMPVLFGGVMLACDKSYKGNRLEFGDFFAGFRSHFSRLVGLGLTTLLLYIAVYGIIAVIFGTSAALVLSGMEQPPSTDDPAFIFGMLIAILVVLALSIPIYMAVWFSYALVTINDFGVFQAIKTSFNGCLKNVLPFLVYGIVMFLLAIVASIPVMLGWLILGPVLAASFYTGYRDIFYAD